MISWTQHSEIANHLLKEFSLLLVTIFLLLNDVVRFESEILEVGAMEFPILEMSQCFPMVNLATVAIP